MIVRKAEGLDAGTETASNLHQKLYYHQLGTDQQEDVLCYEAPDEPKWMFGAEVTDDGKVGRQFESWLRCCDSSSTGPVKRWKLGTIATFDEILPVQCSAWNLAGTRLVAHSVFGSECRILGR